jgi:hypothetical protein
LFWFSVTVAWLIPIWFSVTVAWLIPISTSLELQNVGFLVLCALQPVREILRVTGVAFLTLFDDESNTHGCPDLKHGVARMPLP